MKENSKYSIPSFKVDDIRPFGICQISLNVQPYNIFVEDLGERTDFDDSWDSDFDLK